MGAILPHFGSILDPIWDRFGFIVWHLKPDLAQNGKRHILDSYT